MYRDAEEGTIVAAYCRVSTENDDQANSFESQQRFFSQYIESHPGWELFKVYADRGISGTTTKNRKAFNQMLREAEEGSFSMVITKEISRFARNTLDSIYFTRWLKKRGIGVIFLNDNINTMDGDGELRLSIMASIAQEESRRTSQRVKWGQKRRMEAGIVFGRKMMGYNLKSGKLDINESEAEVVRNIFKKFVCEKKSPADIVRELKAAGVPAGGRIQEWSTTAVLRILKNEKYCGDLVQKKTYTPDYLSHEKKYNRGNEEKVVIKNHHQPIVSREIFNAAGKILVERKTRRIASGKTGNRYILSGKIKCGCCGSNYVARVKKRKDGSEYFGWRCFEGIKNGRRKVKQDGGFIGCNGPTITNESLISMLSVTLGKLEIDRREISEQLIRLIKCCISDACGEDTQEKETSAAKKERLIRLYLEGEIDREEYDRWAKKIKVETEISRGEISPKETCSEDECSNSDLEVREKKIGLRISELLEGKSGEDIFFREILQKAVVFEDGHVEIYLKDVAERISFYRKALQ